MEPAGQIVVLNGAPRAGKSSIATAVQERLPGVWMNIGVDVARRMTPSRAQPGIGLRPGEAAHPAASAVSLLYAGLYESVAAHSRLGINVVVDVGHYDIEILTDASRRLAGLPVLFVGVKCPIEVIMDRRRASENGQYVTADVGADIPPPVLRWQTEVHAGWLYDLEVDTSNLSPEQCADLIRQRLEASPTPDAFARLRGR
jgi:chloramphenicol 3-O phosphotransferase